MSMKVEVKQSFVSVSNRVGRNYQRTELQHADKQIAIIPMNSNYRKK